MAEQNPRSLVKAQGFFGVNKKEQDFAKKTSKELVRVSNQMLSMQTLLQNNISSLNDAVVGDSGKQKKLAVAIQNLNDIETVQNKIVGGQELTQKEAKQFISLSSDVVGNLKELNLQFEVNFADIVNSLKGTLSDTTQDIEDRRKLVQQIRDLAKQKGVDEKTINNLDELLSSNLNFTEQQTKQVEKLIGEVTKDKAFQSKSIATLDQINSSLDASVLTQDELKGLLDKQDQGGQTFSQKFIENPGVFAAGNQVKTGALSSVFGAAGLGGLDTALGLSEKLSVEGLAKGFEKAKGFFNKDKGQQGTKDINADTIINKAISSAPTIKEGTTEINKISDGISKIVENTDVSTTTGTNKESIQASTKQEPLVNIKTLKPKDSGGDLLTQSQIVNNKTDKISDGISKIVENTDIDAKTNTEINKERRNVKADKEQLAAIKALAPKEGELLSQSEIVNRKLGKSNDKPNKSLKEVTKELKGFGKKIKSLGSSFGGFGSILSKVGKIAGPIALIAGVGAAAFKGTQALTKFLAGDPAKDFKDKTFLEKTGTVLSGGGGGLLFDALNKGKTAKFVTVNPNMSVKDLSKAKRILEIQLQGSSLKEDEVARIKLSIKTAQKFIDRKSKKDKQGDKVTEGSNIQAPNINTGNIVSLNQGKGGGLRQDGIKVIQTQAEKESRAIEQARVPSQPPQTTQQPPSPPKQSRGNGVDDLGLTVMNSLVYE